MKVRGPLLWIICLVACGSATQDNDGMSEKCSLEVIERYTVPDALIEISGIAFKPSQYDTIFAIQDEDGKLFWMKPGVKSLKSVPFGKSGDYEDLAIMGDLALVLRSDGVIFSFSIDNAITAGEATKVKKWDDLVPKGEYEGMYIDQTSQQIYVLCKDCEKDDAEKKVSGYILSYHERGISRTDKFKIEVEPIGELTSESKMNFRPSALSRHPSSGEWYILSSVNRILVVTDSEWKPQRVYKLPESEFTQPEGLAFDGEGQLFISSEGSKTKKASISKVRDN
jgi:uncharacterized protein YjiK